MHSAKSKSKGVSTNSLFDLKAEISKKEDEFARDKAAGKTYTLGRVNRPDKKPTKWSLPNKGVQSRAARDLVEQESVSKPTLENARISLERKSVKYHQLVKGKTAGLTEKQYDALLVDFDAKGIDSKWESDSDDVDESLTVPVPNNEDDPMIEYVDEYGRNRTARRSEVPRLAKRDDETQEFDDGRHPSVTFSLSILSPNFPTGNAQILQNHFPTYQHTEDRITEIINEHSEENNPLEKHYDPNSEIRDRGAASYTFSTDEETRQARLNELKSRHLETDAIRKEMGAVDVLPGEIEGMQVPEVRSSVKGSEKRKREMEERRKMLDAKRKKVGTRTVIEEPQPDTVSASTSGTTTSLIRNSQTPGLPQQVDPFSALESATFSKPPPNKGKGKSSSQHDADEFLAQLGNEMLNKKRK
ncbi:uncharacterized protein C8R40DRAFT_1048842 [Lentinula edodes]|uniref:uncharacterized protein n=1 Tax=Lentinula edodes TaxID=5353 RepID=UPI001E8E02D2|nr:uncharacterized protein C8R40DRAFT_1048842 [Lentinula edodes]KAH7873791.1 hypothetical protein C8R40DRAFT_1048842 [Lentinula edodes]